MAMAMLLALALTTCTALELPENNSVAELRARRDPLRGVDPGESYKNRSKCCGNRRKSYEHPS